ncbi:MAG: hypothetical protein Q4A05_05385 [Ruminococcus sp.]|nr:hypothetical protein [Ruminococcus sp.]
MKHNAIFVVLTALILALGFYGADIIGHFFPSDTAEEAVIPRDSSNTNAIYLKEEKQKFNPMSIVAKSSQSVYMNENSEVRSLTAAMITAMARQNKESYIFQPVGNALDKSLKFDKNGYIYVEKWQYLNSDSETRCLDCIVWTNDLSIVYIRFYSDEVVQLSGSEMNAGLDRLDRFSSQFYPYESDSYYTLQQIKDEQIQSFGSVKDDAPMWDGDLTDMVHIGEQWSAIDIIPYVTRKYEAYNDAARERLGSPDNPLVGYWMSQLSFCDIITSHSTYVVGASKVTDLFMSQLGIWVKPSYSAKDGIIYQTMNLSGHELTVIYNVRDDVIEGYFYPDSAEIPYYNEYFEESYG